MKSTVVLLLLYLVHGVSAYYSGIGTFFTLGLGTGDNACGYPVTGNQFLVALDIGLWNTRPNGGWCGHDIQLAHNNRVYAAKIVDLCPTCGYGNLDLAQNFFQAVDPDLNDGIISIIWCEGSSCLTNAAIGASDVVPAPSPATVKQQPVTITVTRTYYVTPIATTTAQEQQFTTITAALTPVFYTTEIPPSYTTINLQPEAEDQQTPSYTTYTLSPSASFIKGPQQFNPYINVSPTTRPHPVLIFLALLFALR